MNYFARELLGEHQSLTSEGYLICKDVPIARTGEMIYGPGELYDEKYGMIPVGPDGMIVAHRSVEDVFTQETMDSFNLKPIVYTHPEEDVTAENWKEYMVGSVSNVRRGQAPQDDLMLADFCIMAPEIIERVRTLPPSEDQSDRLREVSCGYSASYDQLEMPGHVRQYNIRGNHVALVESGRCGPRCAIGDSRTVRQEEVSNMSWLDKVKAAFKAKDEAALDAALAEAPKDAPLTLTKDQLSTIAALVRTADDDKRKQHDDDDDDCDCAMCKKHATTDAAIKDLKKSVDDIGTRVKKIEDDKKDDAEKEDKEIEGELEEEAPPGSGDKAKKAKDSSYLADAWQESLSLAEAIAPGVTLPTLDAKAVPAQTLQRMCAFRRTALELGSARPELRSFIDALRGGREVKDLTCDQLRPIFKATGQHAMGLNNRSEEQRRANNNEAQPKPKLTLAKLNEINREFYAQK
jgi:hypothetical protein